MHLGLKGKSFIIAAAALVLLIFLHSLELFSAVEKILFRASSPLQKRFYSAGIRTNSFFDKFKAGNDGGEIDILKTQIRSLMLQNSRLKLAAEENKILKKELSFTRQHKYDFIGARIMGTDSLYNSPLLILEIENDEYSEKDVENNMPVIVEDGILVGKIALVKENRIYMMPTTAAQSAVAATILNKDYTMGVAEGELNLAIIMRMIPQSEKVKSGDIIVTSGLETKMPKGLLLGTVSKVAQDQQTPFNIAYVTPLYNPKRLSSVLIIRKY
jgi:rod shape-determining protein MreC